MNHKVLQPKGNLWPLILVLPFSGKETRVQISALHPRPQGEGSSRERTSILVSFLLNLHQCSCPLYLSSSSWWHPSPHDYSAQSPTLHFSTDCLSPVRASLMSYPEPGIPQLSSQFCPRVSETGVWWATAVFEATGRISPPRWLEVGGDENKFLIKRNIKCVWTLNTKYTKFQRGVSLWVDSLRLSTLKPTAGDTLGPLSCWDTLVESSEWYLVKRLLSIGAHLVYCEAHK